MIKCLVISGIDGSGKTTVIDSLRDSLKLQGKKTEYIWLRFNHYFAKIMHAIARVLKLSVRVNNEMGIVWQHQLYKSKLFCWFYIWATYFDTKIGKLKYKRVAKQNPDVIICDRWVTDILVDLATKTRDRNFFDSVWVQRFLKILPEKTTLFIIFRDKTEILNCRIENRTDPDFEFRNNLYNDLLTKPFVSAIDNSGKIKESVQQIIHIISSDL